MQRYLRGQIWWCNCSYDVNSDDRDYDIDDKQKQFNHIQQGMRPVLIISNDKGNRYSETLQIIPCTSAEKTVLPTHCSLYINKVKNTFLCEQMRTINKTDLKTYMITLDDREMEAIEQCIQISLGLTKITQYDKININDLKSVDNETDKTIINNKEEVNGN